MINENIWLIDKLSIGDQNDTHNLRIILIINPICFVIINITFK